MTPREFLDDIVRPNYQEFTDNPSSLRHAHNAISSVDALAAHLFIWCEENAPGETSGVGNDSNYRNHLGEQHPDFLLLRDIAKAQKHVTLTEHKPQVSSAKQVQSRKLGWGEGGYGEGQYGGPQQVVVTTNSGDLHHVEKLINTSIEFFANELQRIGVQ